MLLPVGIIAVILIIYINWIENLRNTDFILVSLNLIMYINIKFITLIFDQF
jgi:hypothetical protein